MKRRYSMIPLMAMLTVSLGCGTDLTGLEDLDDYAGELAAHMEVASVRCNDAKIPMTGTTNCVAFGKDGQILENVGSPLVMWSTPDTAIARVDLGGRVIAMGATGTAQVIARGAKGSSASSNVVVE